MCVLLAACGKASDTNSVNASNSKNSNSASPSSAVSPADIDKGKTLPPTSMDIYDFIGVYDADNEGRIVTVTGGLLEEISYNSLLIRDGSSFAFSCEGNFSEYMEMKTRIDDLRYKHKSPVATVKGIYSKDSSGKPTLKSCVLTDIKK